MEYLRTYQLHLMTIMAGICIVLFFGLLIMKIDEKSKKNSFLQIAFFATLLLVSDRLAYYYRGDVSITGFIMVRVSNFLVFASIILVENGFNDFLFSLIKTEHINEKNKIILMISRGLALFGLTLLTISQFAGIYYTFDETNHYQRANGFIICYMMPLIITVIQSIFIIKNRSIFRKRILIALLVFVAIPTLASVVQIFTYGLSLTSIAIAFSVIILYFLVLMDINHELSKATQIEIEKGREMQEKSQELLYQTIEALASAVDAKDGYTRGHSNRVAMYARKIAEASGLSEDECESVYLAGLLHDVGKIGIDDTIINKEGKLSKDEFEAIKQHPRLGKEILNKIVLAPNLSIGANYHHERYDGKGYPEGLKGEDIPVIARIIAVADAYDAMTSKRSYRDMIPQQLVREELVKGIGTQFDPDYAKIMIHMLDTDEEYQLKENIKEETFETKRDYRFKEFKTDVSVGLRITDCPVTIDMRYESLRDNGMPTLLFYDSADARYYLEEKNLMKEMDFVEFASIDLNGHVNKGYIRDIEENIVGTRSDKESSRMHVVRIDMVKQEDHLLVKVIENNKVYKYIFALWDATRYLYFAFTGKYCNVEILDAKVESEPVSEGYIPRIADKISYINKPTGDIPNVQVDGWRSAESEVVEIRKKMEVTFDTLSLPCSRRVWHCPIVCIFTSDDGTINGNNYKEVALIRLDGEVWTEYKEVINNFTVSKDEDFDDWNVWKQHNLSGVTCNMSMKHEEDKISVKIENSGVTIVNQTILPEITDKVYFFFTGDQCALTNIHINKY